MVVSGYIIIAYVWIFNLNLKWVDGWLSANKIFRSHHRKSKTTAISSGYGIATDYTWKEEAYELDVTVKVPPNTRAKDIIFKATTKSIDLRLKKGDDDEIVLLNGGRKLRGRVNIDGTFWVISDEEDGDSREVTVTIEKHIKTPVDDFEVVEYDWKGVYNDDKDEVSERKYDEPEKLDVREYAASLGVDIDNLNMSMVDKTMFSSNLNLTKSTLNELSGAGYLDNKEITQQADGTEYTVNDEGEAEPYSPFGEKNFKPQRQEVPFLDTDSPWHNATTNNNKQSIFQQTRNFTRAAFAQDSAKGSTENNPYSRKKNVDPIESLTVERLKEILKSQGMKVSGNKKELQDRLRQRVNSLLQGQQDHDK